MLIKDKFNPIFLEDFEINKKVAQKYLNFFDKSYIQNSIIYGNNGCGKYTFVNCIINTIYQTNIKKNNTNIKIGSKEHKIISSNYHFEILLDKYNNNYSNICDIIDYLTDSQEINDLCTTKIIVIRNILSCKNDLLMFLKSKIEKSNGNYCFFLITNNVSNINLKYRGLFNFINIPYENKEVITNYFDNKIDNFNKKIFKNIIDDTQNLNIILTSYELGVLNKAKPFLELKFNKIFGLIKDSLKNPDNIIKIRDEIYEINIKNLDFNLIILKLLKELLSEKTLSDVKKYEIVSEYSKYSINIVNCYKEQIHYEALISNIIYIYHK